MLAPKVLAALAACAQLSNAGCPYMDGDASDLPASHPVVRREESAGSPPGTTDKFMAQFEVNDTNTYMTSNTGVPIEDQESLSAGERGPTLLEDFIFREKIMHFGKDSSERINMPY